MFFTIGMSFAYFEYVYVVFICISLRTISMEVQIESSNYISENNWTETFICYVYGNKFIVIYITAFSKHHYGTI